MNRIMIAGTSSGVGKTTISLGIMRALSNRGLKVQPYKVGPDYIDPSYHTFITGRYSRNLDPYMLDEEKIKYIVKSVSDDADISVVEGVMGLYDGFGTDIDNCSSSSVSKMIKTPVVLVINGKAMAASAAAMVKGYMDIDKNVDIKAVIANNVRTESHYSIIKKSVEKYCDVEVIGYFPPNSDFSLESRHLGLVPMAEMDNLSEKFAKLGEEIEKYIDIDRLIEISSADDIENEFDIDNELEKRGLYEKSKGLKAAVAMDRGCNFYYRENLEIFEKLGIEVEYFSPLEDKCVPDADFIYIGGGFPEIFSEELEKNSGMRKSIYDAHINGTPIYAECGGLMYLGKTITDSEGNTRDMVGILNGISEMTSRLKRFGYCIGEAKEDTLLSKKGDTIKGHEFHHSIFCGDEKCVYTMRKIRDNEVVDEWEGGYSKGNTLATYLHTHFYNNLDCIKNLIEKAVEVKNSR